RRVRFTVDATMPPGTFAANQSVTVSIPAGAARDILTVHKDAVLNRQGATFVIVNVDGKASFRPVDLGESMGGRFEVKRGLVAGDEVVVRGNERLRPDQPITTSKTSAGG
ncbi:MAG: efflux RND transporter periplasmic adaptor subunit, partial [Proteobacteria bacterium]|nr:efflux RND transporter periplasmic adaptor subunit [Pseudomonadota bacterium]